MSSLAEFVIRIGQLRKSFAEFKVGLRQLFHAAPPVYVEFPMYTTKAGKPKGPPF
jgi:hypothetical protein